MATWIKCTDTKHEVVYINLDNAVTVTRNDVADRISERGTVISFMGGEQIYIVVNEQPEEIIKPKLQPTENQTKALLRRLQGSRHAAYRVLPHFHDCR